MFRHRWKRFDGSGLSYVRVRSYKCRRTSKSTSLLCRGLGTTILERHVRTIVALRLRVRKKVLRPCWFHSPIDPIGFFLDLSSHRYDVITSLVSDVTMAIDRPVRYEGGGECLEVVYFVTFDKLFAPSKCFRRSSAF